MRIAALAALALALSACGSSDDGNTAGEANALGTDDMLMDENLTLDANAMNGMGGMDANASANGAAQNLMEKDSATNDPDTNLANGL